MVDRVGDRDREPAASDDVQGIGGVAFVEEDVAADEGLFVAAGSDCADHLGRRSCKEFRRCEQILVSHAEITVLPSMVVPLAEPENVWTVVVAGGSGARFGRPKQYELVGDQRMVDRSVEIATQAGTAVVLVVPPGDVDAESTPGRLVVAGGATRSESVRAGLAAVPSDATIVCVHDAARPFATAALFRAVIAAVAGGADAVVPGLAVSDTIKVVDEAGVVTCTPPRESLVAVQTPQAFRAAVLRAAHARAAAAGVEATDDAALVEAAGHRVVVIAGEPDNRKVTHLSDLEWARSKAMAR